MTSSPFWIDDYKILYDNKNYISFFPSSTMTKNEQLNCLTRFSIYLFILLLIFSDNSNWLFVPIFIIVLCIFLAKTQNFESFYKKKELELEGNFAPIKEHNTKSENNCTRPTKSNPFMNVLPTMNPKRKKACNPLSSEIDDEIIDNFEKNNLDSNIMIKPIDIFKNQTSMLPFYTTPVTQIPNDQNAFANWLYKTDENCKTDTQYCLNYSNVKYNKTKW